MKFDIFVFVLICLHNVIDVSSIRKCQYYHKARKYSRKYRDRCLNEFCSSVNTFSLDIMKDFSERKDNFIISPFSISSAFAMLFIGANGNTKAEMASVFKWFSYKNGSIAPTAKELLLAVSRDRSNLSLAYTSEKVFSLANNVWIDKKFGVLESYKKKMKKFFHVKPREVSFAKNSENIRKQINTWVKERTDKKIKQLFSDQSITSLTRMVLANAVYFKGAWSTPFNPRSTFTGEFYPNGRAMGFTNVKYMHERRMSLLTYHDRCEKVKLVGLPYEEDFLMLIVMPLKTFIDNTVSRITPRVFNKWLVKLRYRKMELVLPKFTIENSIDLVEYFKEKKMKDLFTKNQADLSNITKTNRLYVSAAVHKSFVSVDETGTTASGATGIGIDTYSTRKQIKINRPFLFYILCRKTNTIIFTGKVTYPSEDI